MAMRRWVFSLVIISVTLLMCEAVLQVAKLVNRPARRLLMPSWEVGDLTITDVRLGRRGNPDHLEHDARGYRNKEALSRSDVVVLGDSHAYGAGVAREEA